MCSNCLPVDVLCDFNETILESPGKAYRGSLLLSEIRIPDQGR